MIKSLYPKTSKEKAKVYLHCMAEIVARMETINDIDKFQTRKLFAREFSHLQLRHICELIAIACLVAQGDYETFRAFTTEYSPKKIFRSLHEINPHFFPQPSTRTYQDGRHHLEANSVDGAADKNKIIDIWSVSGGHLHRASLKKYLKKTFNPLPESNHVEDSHAAIALLLNSHIISLRSEPNDAVVTLLEVHLDDGDGKLVADFLHINKDNDTIEVESFRAEDLASQSDPRNGQ